MNPLMVLWAALMGLLVLVFGALLLNVLAIDPRTPLGLAVQLGLLALGLFWVLRVAGGRRGR